MVLKFRKVNNKDLTTLKIIRNQDLSWLHKKRIKNQEKGISEYLIFFKDNRPVAHIDIVFRSRTPYHNCPILQDLYVKESERKKGIAKKVIKIIEERLKQKGFRKIGIDVETKEKWIEQFYLNLGFRVEGGIRSHSYFDESEGKRIRLRVYHLEKKI